VTDYRNLPILRQALAHWHKMRGARAMPARRDFDPAEVPALLPHVQLIDRVAGRYRYRLVGTELVQVFGRDYTGQFPDEMFSDNRGPFICQVFDRVREARQPMFLRSRYITAKNVEFAANRLYLPLSGDGHEVNMILGVLTFDFGSIAPVAGAWGSAELAPDGSYLELVPLDGAG
jgi:hypothetical protein